MHQAGDDSIPGRAGLWPVRLESPPEPHYRDEPLWHQPGRALWVAASLPLQPTWFTAEREDLPAGVLDVPTDLWPLNPEQVAATADAAAVAWLGGWTTASAVVEELSVARGLAPYEEGLGVRAGDPLPWLAHVAATSPETNEWWLEAKLSLLAADPDFSVRRMVAAHQRVPPAVLAHLAVDVDASVRLAAARNRGCAPDQLSRLAEDQDPQVVRAVAAHPRTPSRVLRLLAAEAADEGTREAAFTNPNLDAEDFAELAGRFSEYVAGRSRHYPGTEWLGTGDPRLSVDAAAARLRSEPSYRRDVREPPFDRPVVERRTLDRHFFEEEWGKVDALVDALVRFRPDLPPDVLEHLFAEAIRWRAWWMDAVISHSNAPRHLLGLLLDEDAVARAEASRPEMTWVPATIRGQNPPAVVEWARRLARNPHTPVDLLTELASHLDEEVRCYLAANEACPPQVTAALAFDASEQVRVSLAGRLLPGDPLLNHLRPRDLTPRRLALHLATDVRITHRLLPQVLRLVTAYDGPVGPARAAALTVLG